MLYFALMLCLLPGLAFSQVQTPPAGPSPEEELLTEIRDQLRSNASTALSAPTSPDDVIMDKSWGNANLVGKFEKMQVCEKFWKSLRKTWEKT